MSEDLQARAAHSMVTQQRAAENMARIGIDPAFISTLVETFYRRIREHETLGPVFDNRLSGRWPEHMETMKSFWSSVAFKTGTYGGKPVQAHMGVSGMSADLFPQWLSLFAGTLDDIAPTRQAHEWFLHTADRIARSLTLSLFYNPALDDPERIA